MNKIENLVVKRFNEKYYHGACEVFKVTIPYAIGGIQCDEDREFVIKEVNNKKLMLEDALYNKGTNYTFLVAKSNDKVIGTISFGPCTRAIKICTNNEFENLGEMGSLFVLPEYQNKGVGSALIEGLQEYLKEQGINEFCLDSGYEDGQRRWRRKFGEPYVIVKDYWGEGIDNFVWKVTI